LERVKIERKREQIGCDASASSAPTPRITSSGDDCLSPAWSSVCDAIVIAVGCWLLVVELRLRTVCQWLVWRARDARE
jgi:hypothetical protein